MSIVITLGWRQGKKFYRDKNVWCIGTCRAMMHLYKADGYDVKEYEWLSKWMLKPQAWPLPTSHNLQTSPLLPHLWSSFSASVCAVFLAASRLLHILLTLPSFSHSTWPNYYSPSSYTVEPHFLTEVLTHHPIPYEVRPHRTLHFFLICLYKSN